MKSTRNERPFLSLPYSERVRRIYARRGGKRTREERATTRFMRLLLFPATKNSLTYQRTIEILWKYLFLSMAYRFQSRSRIPWQLLCSRLINKLPRDCPPLSECWNFLDSPIRSDPIFRLNSGNTETRTFAARCAFQVS